MSRIAFALVLGLFLAGCNYVPPEFSTESKLHISENCPLQTQSSFVKYEFRRSPGVKIDVETYRFGEQSSYFQYFQLYTMDGGKGKCEFGMGPESVIETMFDSITYPDRGTYESLYSDSQYFVYKYDNPGLSSNPYFVIGTSGHGEVRFVIATDRESVHQTLQCLKIPIKPDIPSTATKDFEDLDAFSPAYSFGHQVRRCESDNND